MLDAIGAILPMAIGVTLSPMPMIAVVLMLVSAKARVNGPMFVLGWVVGLAVVGTVVLLVVGSNGTTDEGEPETWVAILKLVLGALLLLLAVKQWRDRPKNGVEVAMPKWMSSIDAFTPAKSAGMAALLGSVNPKNLLFIIAAATAIAQTGISGGEQAVAYGVFTVLASVGVAVPVIVYFSLGDRAPALLQEMKVWLTLHNSVIMAVLLLVIGVKLLGDGLAGL
jgi:threonine/homoserine/homoserine lactone efflux protein